MIKTIKPGLKKFRAKCNYCLCLFEYEIADINNYECIICPDCGKSVEHNAKNGLNESSFGNLNTTNNLNDFNLIKPLFDTTQPSGRFPNSDSTIDHCANCPNRLINLDKLTYVGDTPCDFCQHNPYRVTCITAKASSSLEN